MAFVAGAIAGAAVALLYAPATGDETREFLGQRAREGKDRAAEAAPPGTRDTQQAARESDDGLRSRSRSVPGGARDGAGRVTPLSETFLGLIALAVLVMAGGQIVVVMLALRTTRGLTETLNRIEQ